MDLTLLPTHTPMLHPTTPPLSTLLHTMLPTLLPIMLLLLTPPPPLLTTPPQSTPLPITPPPTILNLTMKNPKTTISVMLSKNTTNTVTPTCIPVLNTVMDTKSRDNTLCNCPIAVPKSLTITSMNTSSTTLMSNTKERSATTSLSNPTTPPLITPPLITPPLTIPPPLTL